MAIKLFAGPADLAVSLERVKKHLRVDNDDEDDLITGYLMAAIGTIDGKDAVLGRAIMPQTWDLYLDIFPTGAIKVPLPPLISIETIEYVNSGGTLSTIDAGAYRVDNISEPGWIVPGVDGWPKDVMPTANAVRVRFLAGYEAIPQSPPVPNSGVPAPLQQAVLLMVGSFYENKAEQVVALTISQLPWGVDALVSPYILMSI